MREQGAASVASKGRHVWLAQNLRPLRAYLQHHVAQEESGNRLSGEGDKRRRVGAGGGEADRAHHLHGIGGEGVGGEGVGGEGVGGEGVGGERVRVWSERR